MPPIVGVIGTSQASSTEWDIAKNLGKEIASRGWILVTGGLAGVMEAASEGAHEARGVVVGIVPGPSTRDANRYVTIPIATNMGHARNVIIAHTADILIAVGGGEGTLAEIAIARKLRKPVFGIHSWEVAGALAVPDAASALKACEQFFLKERR